METDFPKKKGANALMTGRKELDIMNHKIWKDKKINPECKIIYAYVYSKGFNRISTYVNVRRFMLVPCLYRLNVYVVKIFIY